MGLPACQQRSLDKIAGALLARDPKLASLFSIFTRLTRQEPMPSREKLDGSGRLRRALRALRWLRPRAWLRPAVLVPVALAAILSALVLSPLAASPRLCGPAPTWHVPAHQLAKAKSCGTARPKAARYSHP
jgi:hypothetical protein